ncbi:MAG: GTP-binding protein LepA [Actinobacteria bacterium]|nr:GTP-binding protein LepA [Actinomycetota bacterium]
MARATITSAAIMQHVLILQDEHPPIRLDSVDRTILEPVVVRERLAPVIDYLARVELEVDRNVLELLTLLPGVSELDRYFYQDVWQPQEIAHGLILDRLQVDLGLPPAEVFLGIPMRMKLLGALAHLPAVQEISRFLYYLTGAATEKQAVVAYSRLTTQLDRLGETAISRTVIGQIKRQEPGHYAFYQMSATQMVQDEVLAPWQMFLARVLREKGFALVGTNYVPEYQAQLGAVLVGLELDLELERYAKDMGRLEARLLWANRNGMAFPPYFLEALRQSVDMYREKGFSRQAV